ncbi:MAG: ATP-dependent DNA helicase RecG, partial [Spirochaetaceae bacterium]|nr:ATP-dependent DNA helicase RecG [Spirochaetaceae bacterium]
MFLRELKTPVSNVRGISDKRAAELAKIGVLSVAALLARYPKDYEDRSETVPLSDYAKKRAVCTTVRVVDHASFLFR